MRVRHPDPDTDYVDVRGALVPVGDDGAFDAPEPWVNRWCDTNGYSVRDVQVVDEWSNWNRTDWLELDYTDRVDDVKAGRVDGHLDDIADCETSKNVRNAVEKRIAELED